MNTVRPPWSVAAAALAQQPPTTQPAAGEASPVLLGLLAVGIVALGVWIVRRLARPRPLTLTPTPNRPNRLTALHLLALLGGWILVTGAAYQLTPLPPLLGIVAGLQVLWFAACLLIAARTFRHGLRRGLGLTARHWLYDLGRAVWGYLAVLPVCIALLALMQTLLPPDLQHRHIILQVLADLPLGWQIAAAVSTIILAPLMEETLFRGLLQSALRRGTGQPWAAIALTAAIFTVFHMTNLQDLPALFALAVVLGYNYERTGRLTAPIVIHALFNGVFFIETWRAAGS